MAKRMEIINAAVFFSVMIVLAVEDIREKRIMIIPPLLFCAYIFAVHIFFPTIEISEMLFGLLLGGIMMAVSVLTKGRIGMGDAVIYTCMIGPFFGGLKALAVLFTASLSSAVFSVFYILRQKKRRRVTEGGADIGGRGASIRGKELPFVPFTLIGAAVEYFGGFLT